MYTMLQAALGVECALLVNQLERAKEAGRTYKCIECMQGS